MGKIGSPIPPSYRFLGPPDSHGGSRRAGTLDISLCTSSGVLPCLWEWMSKIGSPILAAYRFDHLSNKYQFHLVVRATVLPLPTIYVCTFPHFRTFSPNLVFSFFYHSFDISLLNRWPFLLFCNDHLRQGDIIMNVHCLGFGFGLPVV